MTTVSDINTYISLKNTLVSQIQTDDTIANIQSTLASIATQKNTIISGLSTSTVLDNASIATTDDKMDYCHVTQQCLYNDNNLSLILVGWFKRVDDQLISATDPTIINNLIAKENTIRPIIKSTIPQAYCDLIMFINNNF